MTFSSTADRLADEPHAAAPPAAARLELAFARAPDGHTYIASQYAGYPFHVCRPHFIDPELPGLATLYVQSCAGGLFEDDRLACDVAAAAGTAVHLTSAASTIVHSSRRGGQADLSTSIRAAAGAFVEYLPEPVILFPRARLTTRLDLTLDPLATIVLSDAFIIHDPACLGELPASIASTVCAKRNDGTVLARDRIAVSGEAFRPGTPGMMGPWRCHGTLMLFTRKLPADDLCASVRKAVGDCAGAYCGVSTLPNDAGVWARFLASDAIALRGALANAWKESRRLLTGHVPAARRK